MSALLMQKNKMQRLELATYYGTVTFDDLLLDVISLSLAMKKMLLDLQPANVALCKSSCASSV